MVTNYDFLRIPAVWLSSSDQLAIPVHDIGPNKVKSIVLSPHYPLHHPHRALESMVITGALTKFQLVGRHLPYKAPWIQTELSAC